MQAVILSGGLGTRLRSVDSTVPKPMIKVAGRPFLEHMILMLEGHGLRKFLFLVSYKSEIVIEFLKRIGAERDLEIDWSIEDDPAGTGGALKLAEDKLAEDFLLLNGDSYLDIDYQAMIAGYQSAGCLMMVAAYDDSKATDVNKNIAVEQGGHVVLYDKSGSDVRLNYIDAGALMCSKKILGLIEKGKKCSLEQEIYAKVMERRAMRAFPVKQRFYDIGTPDRLKEFEQVMQGQK